MLESEISLLKTKVCKVCGKKYKPHRGINRITSKYCSLQCSGKAKANQVEKKCRNCGLVFNFKPSQLKAYPNSGKYCSRRCGYDYRVKKNAARPTDDRYGRTNRVADIAWRTAVKERDNGVCQRCGVINEQMHAHHKATRGAHPELKYDLSNGITLCNSCHTWVHHHPKESYESGWLVRG